MKKIYVESVADLAAAVEERIRELEAEVEWLKEDLKDTTTRLNFLSECGSFADPTGVRTGLKLNALRAKLAKAEEALEAWEGYDNAPQEDFDTSDGVGYELQEHARTLTQAALRGEEGKT